MIVGVSIVRMRSQTPTLMCPSVAVAVIHAPLCHKNLSFSAPRVRVHVTRTRYSYTLLVHVTRTRYSYTLLVRVTSTRYSYALLPLLLLLLLLPSELEVLKHARPISFISLPQPVHDSVNGRLNTSVNKLELGGGGIGAGGGEGGGGTGEEGGGGPGGGGEEGRGRAGDYEESDCGKDTHRYILLNGGTCGSENLSAIKREEAKRWGTGQAGGGEPDVRRRRE